MRRLMRHPNIVSMLGAVYEENNFGILLEFVKYGPLDIFMKQLKCITGACNNDLHLATPFQRLNII